MEPGWAEARAEGTLQGLRMTAAEFFDRPDDGHRYELVEGVVAAMTFWRLRAGRYLEIKPDGKRFASEAIPGFVLDLMKVRKTFRAASPPAPAR